MTIKREIGVTDALQSLRPGAAWVIRDDELDYFDTNPLPCPTLEELEQEMTRLRYEAKWEEIKRERDRRKSLGVRVYTGSDAAGSPVYHWFHSDTESRIQWLGLEAKANKAIATGGTQNTVLTQLGQPIAWKAQGTDAAVPVTVQLAYDVNNAVGDLDALLFYVANQHKSAMMQSENPDDYDYSTMWPTTQNDPTPV